MGDIEGLKRKLAGMQVEDDPQLVRKKSRDFYWYSPILKRDLDSVTADIVFTPRSEDELVEALAAAYAAEVPVTPRGGGTGNYGQAMPLSRGMVVSLTDLKDVKAIGPGEAVAGAGAILSAMDAATKAHSGQEIRMFPSTFRSATIGGFVAGGSGGVGSIHWGGLRDAGNVTKLRIVTMEDKPRVMELEGDAIAQVAHAYGTNGIITEVGVPLAPAYDWVDCVVTHDTLASAAAFADRLGNAAGILIKELAVMQAPITHDYLRHYARFVRADQAAVLIMVAPHAMSALAAFVARHGGAIAFQSDRMAGETTRALPPLFESTWNHTTLYAGRVDPAITYLQVHFPFPDHLALVAEMVDLIGPEMMMHLEFIRFDGKVMCSGLPLIRYTSEERLDAIIKSFEDNGCRVFNPHRYTLEEGGMKQSDMLQLSFKREVDPKGLLNPGKMIAWEDPNFDFSSNRVYLFPGLAS